MECLEEDIIEVIPELTKADICKLIKKVNELANSTNDLIVLEDGDLAPELKRLPARRLIGFWKKKYKKEGEGSTSTRSVELPAVSDQSRTLKHETSTLCQSESNTSKFDDPSQMEGDGGSGGEEESFVIISDEDATTAELPTPSQSSSFTFVTTGYGNDKEQQRQTYAGMEVKEDTEPSALSVTITESVSMGKNFPHQNVGAVNLDSITGIPSANVISIPIPKVACDIKDTEDTSQRKIENCIAYNSLKEDIVGKEASTKDDTGSDAAEVEEPLKEASTKDDTGSDATEVEEPLKEASTKDDTGSDATEVEEPLKEASTKDDTGSDAVEVEKPLKEAITKDDAGADAAEVEAPLKEAGIKDVIGCNAAEAEELLKESDTKDDTGSAAAEVKEPLKEASTKDGTGSDTAEVKEPLKDAITKNDTLSDADEVKRPLKQASTKDDTGSDAAEVEELLEEASTKHDVRADAVEVEKPLKEAITKDDAGSDAAEVEAPLKEAGIKDVTGCDAAAAEGKEPLKQAGTKDDTGSYAAEAEGPINKASTKDDPGVDEAEVKEPLKDAITKDDTLSDADEVKRPLRQAGTKDNTGSNAAEGKEPLKQAGTKDDAGSDAAEVEGPINKASTKDDPRVDEAEVKEPLKEATIKDDTGSEAVEDSIKEVSTKDDTGAIAAEVKDPLKEATTMDDTGVDAAEIKDSLKEATTKNDMGSVAVEVRDQLNEATTKDDSRVDAVEDKEPLKEATTTTTKDDTDTDAVEVKNPLKELSTKDDTGSDAVEIIDGLNEASIKNDTGVDAAEIKELLKEATSSTKDETRSDAVQVIDQLNEASTKDGTGVDAAEIKAPLKEATSTTKDETPSDPVEITDQLNDASTKDGTGVDTVEVKEPLKEVSTKDDTGANAAEVREPLKEASREDDTDHQTGKTTKTSSLSAASKEDAPEVKASTSQVEDPSQPPREYKDGEREHNIPEVCSSKEGNKITDKSNTSESPRNDNVRDENVGVSHPCALTVQQEAVGLDRETSVINKELGQDESHQPVDGGDQCLDQEGTHSESQSLEKDARLNLECKAQSRENNSNPNDIENAGIENEDPERPMGINQMSLDSNEKSNEAVASENDIHGHGTRRTSKTSEESSTNATSGDEATDDWSSDEEDFLDPSAVDRPRTSTRIHFCVHIDVREKNDVRLQIKSADIMSPGVRYIVNRGSCYIFTHTTDKPMLKYRYILGEKKRTKRKIKIDQTQRDVYVFHAILPEESFFQRHTRTSGDKENRYYNKMHALLLCLDHTEQKIQTLQEKVYLNKLLALRDSVKDWKNMPPEQVSDERMRSLMVHYVKGHISSLEENTKYPEDETATHHRIALAIILVCLNMEGIIGDFTKDLHILLRALELPNGWKDTYGLVEDLREIGAAKYLLRWIERTLLQRPMEIDLLKLLPVLQRLQHDKTIPSAQNQNILLTAETTDVHRLDDCAVLEMIRILRPMQFPNAIRVILSRLSLYQLPEVIMEVPLEIAMEELKKRMQELRYSAKRPAAPGLMARVCSRIKKRVSSDEGFHTNAGLLQCCEQIIEALDPSKHIEDNIFMVEAFIFLQSTMNDVDEEQINRFVTPILGKLNKVYFRSEDILRIYVETYQTQGWRKHFLNWIKEAAIIATKDLLTEYQTEGEWSNILDSPALVPIYSHIFDEEWRKGESVRRMLRWKLMDAFLYLFYDTLTPGLYTEKEKLETRVAGILSAVANANLTMQEFETIFKYEAIVKELADVCKQWTSDIPDANMLINILQLRKKQFERVICNTHQLQVLLRRCTETVYCSDAMWCYKMLDKMLDIRLCDLLQLPTLQEQLRRDDWTDHIQLDVPKETLQIMQCLYELDGSVCFDMHLKRTFQTQKEQTMTMDNFCSCVLQPALDSWRKQCEDLETGQLDLKSAKKLFAHLQERPQPEMLKKELLLMFWAKKPSEIANLLSMTEEATQTMKDLREVDDDMIQLMEAYSTSRELILWIRKELQSAQDVRALVRMYTASPQNAVDLSNASCLDSVATVYTPLIYDIAEGAGLMELLAQFREVRDKSRQEKEIKRKLGDLRYKVSWLEEMKKTQSGEGTDALKQVEIINSSGVYKVGQLNQTIQTNGDYKDFDTIITAIVPSAGDAQDQIYSYSKLKELQSKLMLIGGQNEGSMKEVTYFVEVLDGIRGVAEAYSRIIKHGNTLFKNWTSTFHCNPTQEVNTYIDFGLSEGLLSGKDGTVIEHIYQVRYFMDNCLKGWKDHLSSQRKTFPVLNHFTTNQIVLLRNTLSIIPRNMPESGQGTIPNEVYSLLQSISPECSDDHLQAAWAKTIEKMGTKYKEADVIEEDQKPSDEDEAIVQALLKEGFHRGLILKAMKETDSKDEAELTLWCWSKQDDDQRKCVVDSSAIQRQECHDDVTRILLKRTLGGEGQLNSKLTLLWEQYLGTTNKSVKDLLSIEHLGVMLQYLSEERKEVIRRKLRHGFQLGRPNLVLCQKAEMWTNVLSVYMNNEECPFPTRDEVLLCTASTSYEEVELLLLRAVHNKEKIYMLVNADLLPYEVSQDVEVGIQKITQGHQDYQFVVICTCEQQGKSVLVPALYKHRVETLVSPELEEVQQYVFKKLRVNPTDKRTCTAADPERFAVRVIQSDRSGVGKTLCAHRMAEKVADIHVGNVTCLPLHGKDIDVVSIVKRLLPQSLGPATAAKSSRFYHIDIPHEMSDGVDYLLFNLVILGSLVDPDGYVWWRSDNDFYAIEVMPLLQREIDSSVKPEDGHGYVHRMLELLPTIICHGPVDSLRMLKDIQAHDVAVADQPRDPMRSDHGQLMDDKFFKSEHVQRVYTYLKGIGQNAVHEQINPNEDMDKIDCLETLITHCGIRDPSWAELNHFVQFLNTQWIHYKDSPFCHLANIEIEGTTEKQWDNLPDLPDFVVQAMLQMSKDFATRSLVIAEGNGMTEQKEEEEDEAQADVDKYQFKRKWEASPHPYVFFNSDTQSMTFMGYYFKETVAIKRFIGKKTHRLPKSEETLDLLDPKTEECVKEKFMSQQLYIGLRLNGVKLNEDFDKLTRGEQLEMLGRVMGIQRIHDNDEGYVLTSDNVKKMLAIHMRFRCKIPVIIMGETGCGKTYLVDFMCKLQNPPKIEEKKPCEAAVPEADDPIAAEQNPDESIVQRQPVVIGDNNSFTLKVHGGTTVDDLEKKVREAEAQSKINHEKSKGTMFTVLFLDEVNTTEALGLVKEVLCDGTLNGQPLDMDSGLRIVAACNPYKMHSKEMIQSLEEAGLGYRVRFEDTLDKFGRVPMRCLVYRVQPLPASLIPLVWDFGELDEKAEFLYIREIVRKYHKDSDVDTIAGILHASHRFMRDHKDECSVVSLRDPERAMLVMQWFLENSHLLKDNQSPAKKTWALIMALGVCYHAALMEGRKEYREKVAKSFRNNFKVQNADVIRNEISKCQERIVREIQVKATIARNEALMENVFMMVVCMELRIPLFIVGKPGSSKSLARQLLEDAMAGPSSSSDLFKNFKKVHMASYQCSPHSTSEGILGVFKNCAGLQKPQNTKDFVATVVLDEVGLAEDSPKMPLKTLHHLLEDKGTGDNNKNSHKKVGFIGLSNWALDPAKNNRGLMVRRASPSIDDLLKTAQCLCSSDDNTSHKLREVLPSIATGYYKLYHKIKDDKHKEFFGLRDFYSLVKMLYACAERFNEKPSLPQLRLAILRNFGGLQHFDPLPFFLDKTDEGRSPEESATRMINAALSSDDTNLENRYLLLLTENQMALTILQENLKLIQDAVIIFGSSFPKDLEFSKLCRNINHIKMCMEAGKTAVLLNLEQVYESLYEALNQYYTTIGEDRLVVIGLGTQRIKCKVHKDFKLIVIAESDVVYQRFPIPLINRFEKHILATSTVLSPQQRRVSKVLLDWAQEFTETRPTQVPPFGSRSLKPLTPADIFIGYHKDAIPAVVLQVWKEVGPSAEHADKQEQVLSLCKDRLLLCATPEAVMGVGETGLHDDMQEIQSTYFEKQQHDSLFDYLNDKLNGATRDEFIQVTTHSQLLPSEQINVLSEELSAHITLRPLRAYGTEHEFSKDIESFYVEPTDTAKVLIIQCSAAHEKRELLACCRYIIMEQHIKFREGAPHVHGRHIVLIAQLPRRPGGCFTGFQLGHWECTHIDELYQHRKLPKMQNLLNSRVSYILTPTPGDEIPRLDFDLLFEACIMEAMSKLKDEDTSISNTSRIEKLIKLFHIGPLEGLQFMTIMQKRMCHLQMDREKNYECSPDTWLNQVAISCIRTRTLTLQTQVWQYLQRKMTTLVAGIIGYTDTNNNLGIMLDPSEPEWKRRLWLRMLDDTEVTRLSIEENLGQSEPQEILVKTYGANGANMKGNLPFSWIIKHFIDDCFRQPKQQTGHGQDKIDVSKVFKASKLCTILEAAVKEAGVDVIRKSYLQDFVAMVYKGQNKESEDEVKLVEQAIENAYRNKVQGADIGIDRAIPAIHEAYELIQRHIQLFSQIIQRSPGIVREIKDFHEDKPQSPLCHYDYGIDILAVQFVIHSLQPTTVQLRKPVDCKKWYKDTGDMAPLINSVLTLEDHEHRNDRHGQELERDIENIRNDWERLIAVRIFASMACPPGSDEELRLTLHCPLLWGALEGANMKKRETLEKLDKTLRTIIKYNVRQLEKCETCENSLVNVKMLPCDHEVCIGCTEKQERAHEFKCLKCKEERPIDTQIEPQLSKGQMKLNKFVETCRSFRMEIISRMCLHGSTPLEPGLVELLMQNLTAEVRNAGYPEGNLIDVANLTDVQMRTVLLQLLVTSDQVEDDQIQQEMGKMYSNVNISVEFQQELALLYAQCLEDSYHNRLLQSRSEKEILRNATQHLKDALNQLSPGRDLNVVKKLECIAKVRFGLSVAADYIQKAYRAAGDIPENNKPLIRLHQLAKGVCTVEDRSWPRNFFVKVIVRRYSLEFLQQLSGEGDFEWLIPPESKQDQKAALDRFVLHGEPYTAINKVLMQTFIAKDAQAFIEWSNDPQSKGKELQLLLALIKEADAGQNLDTIQDIIRKSHTIEKKEEIHHILQVNKNLKERSAATKNVVLHAIGTLLLTPIQPLLSTLKQILIKTDRMKESFLPTMPDDQRLELLAAITEGEKVKYTNLRPELYKCPNGHMYAIGDCGRPNMASKCPEKTCRVPIGGIGYNKSAEGNQKVDTSDQTKTGHVLGSASKQLEMIELQRNMSPLQTMIVRLFLHISLFFATSYNKRDVCSLIEPNVPEEEVEDFFWDHIEHDIKVIGQEKGDDDTILLMHAIITALSKERVGEDIQIGDPLLTTKEARQDWEDKFVTTHLLEILQDKEAVVRDAYKRVLEHDTSAMKKLLLMVHEVGSGTNYTGPNLGDRPVMWRYRTRVTLKHASQTLNEMQKGKAMTTMTVYPILQCFLENESLLRAVQLLPRIIKFQRLLLQKYDHMITRVEADNKTLRDFVKSHEELFRDYQRAWKILRENIRKQDTSKEVFELLSQDIGASTPLSTFLPASSGKGKGAVVFVEYLVAVHNNFMDLLSRGSRKCVLGPDVDLRNATSTHLVTYDPDLDLLPLVITHCTSSLDVGQGTRIEYDFASLEYQLKERLLEGKSKIKYEVVYMVFSDNLTVVNKLKSLHSKIPQVTCDLEMQRELRDDARFMVDICDLLSNLDIVIGFLHPIRGEQDKPLRTFMSQDLMMRTVPLPMRVRQKCALKHIKALWLLMSNEREKHAAKSGAEPFSLIEESSNLRKALSENQEEALKKKLCAVNLEMLLLELYECITFYIVDTEDEQVNPEIKFTDYLQEVETAQIGHNALTLPDEVEQVKPILIGQCIDTWRAVNDFRMSME